MDIYFPIYSCDSYDSIICSCLIMLDSPLQNVCVYVCMTETTYHKIWLAFTTCNKLWYILVYAIFTRMLMSTY